MAFQTELFFADTAALEDTALFERFYTRMPPQRKEKIDRMRFPKDKRLSLGAGALLQNAVSAVTGKAELPVISVGAHGKPYFPFFPELHFNLSHSGTKVLCAVSDSEIGCDVERVQGADLKLAERFFTRKEYELLAAQETEAERAALFCRLWVLKESFLKATGAGLSLPLNAFSVLPQGESAYLEQTLDENTYDFFAFTPDSGYFAACCIRGGRFTEPPKLTEADLRLL